MQLMDIDLSHDRDGFLDHIQQKASLLKQGFATGRSYATPHLEADGILFSGMGGSGATANLVRDACTRAMEHPFTIVQHYQIPHHVKQGWHTLALSYSGETEETLSVARDAKARGIDVTAFTTGGSLAQIADRVVPQPTGFHPRVALGHSWMSVLGFLEGSGVLKELTPIEEAVAAVEEVDATCGPSVAEEENPAKQLARQLLDKIPQIYATPAFLGVATYFRAMLNENAKKIAGWELIPECNHNDLNGWASDPNRDHFTVLVLSHAEQNPEIMKRIAFMEGWYKEQGVPWHHRKANPIHSYSEHVVEQARAIQWADYTSFYIAMMRGVDPGSIPAINALKTYLRQGR